MATTFEAQSTRARFWRPWPAALPSLAPGLLLCLAFALAGTLLANLEAMLLGQAWIEGLIVALLLGAVARNLLRQPERYAAGATYATKQLLEVAIALLGLSVDTRALFAAGPALLLLVAGGVTASLFASFSIGRLLGLSPHLAALVAAGNSICGNSAIAAVAPAINARRQDIGSAIALTAVLGVAVVLLLPITIQLLGLSHYQYGVVAGMSVYAVPQVLAATFPVSALAGEVGTMVKLLRVLMRGPVVLAMALLFRRGAARAEAGAPTRWSTYVPWFVVAFLALAVVRGFGLVPEPVAASTHTVSSWLTVLAMAGIGLGVELAAVRRVGARVGLAVLLSLSFMITLSILAARLLPLAG